MNPTLIGISMFATSLSTSTYLVTLHFLVKTTKGELLHVLFLPDESECA